MHVEKQHTTWKKVCYIATTWTGPLGRKLTYENVNWEQWMPWMVIFFGNGSIKTTHPDITVPQHNFTWSEGKFF